MSQQWIPKWKKASDEPAPIQAMSKAAGPGTQKQDRLRPVSENVLRGHSFMTSRKIDPKFCHTVMAILLYKSFAQAWKVILMEQRCSLTLP